MPTITVSQAVVQVGREFATHGLEVSQVVIQVGRTQPLPVEASQVVIEVGYRVVPSAIRVPRHAVVMGQPMIV